MKRHLTEKELIEYRFKLASAEQDAASAEHVAGCAECRGRLEKLDRKFAALDLLKEDVHASEGLIAQVVEQTKGPAKAKVVPFYTLRWIGAVAAVLVIGFMMFMGGLTEEEPTRFKTMEKQDVADSARRSGRPDEVPVESKEHLAPASVPKPDSRVAMVPKGKGGGETIVDSDLEELSTRMYAFDASSGKGVVSGILQPTEPVDAAGDSEKEFIPEQAPFAPASAIELVTLPRRDSVQLTIYNTSDLDSIANEVAVEESNERDIRENRGPQRPPTIVSDSLTLVRERRNLTLKRGWNWLQFMWANTLIDPTSLSLEPLEQADKIDIQQLVFPARLRELGRWLIRSEISGQVPFELTYFTSGLSWRAFYMGTLLQDEKSMHLSGYVRLANHSGEDYENAQTRLVVGKVHLLDQIALLAQRQYPYDRPGLSFGKGFDFDGDSVGVAVITNGAWWRGGMGGMGGMGGGMMGGMMPKEIRKEGLSEYFLYTIEGTETIPNEWGKRLLSFEADDIDVESLYKYDEEHWGREAIRFIKFSNDEEHNLGDTPIPNGTIRIYGRADAQGLLSYVGGTEVKYIPVDEEIELNLGPARLVEIEPKLMDFKTDNYVFDRRGNVSGWDEIRTWKIEMTNTRTLPVEVEITRGFETPYWTLQSDAPYKKHDATHARFEVSLEPRSKRAIEYAVTTCHGEREQTLTQ